MKLEIQQSYLDQFSGNCESHRHFTGLVYTDGIKYLMDHGAAWLIDAIASYQKDKRITTNWMLCGFQLWELNVSENQATLTLKEDSNRPVIIAQKIHCTDFPLKYIKIYVEGDTILLPSEH